MAGSYSWLPCLATDRISCSSWLQSQELVAAEKAAREDTTQAVISMKGSYENLSNDLEDSMRMITQCAPAPCLKLHLLPAL